MTGKKETGVIWHNITVVLRSDIYRQALKQGIDISDACNTALAGLVGTEYRRQRREEIPPPPPVIIAKDGATPRTQGERLKVPSVKLHPVINADDPAAPAKVVQATVSPQKKAVTELSVPFPVPALPEEKPASAPYPAVKKATVSRREDTQQKKRSKGDTLKTFFSAKICRTDDTEATISKDDLYELFARFCRDHRITPVPERRAITVALKNQFALSEKTVGGKAFWTGIRLK
jgi:hypothetical protein